MNSTIRELSVHESEQVSGGSSWGGAAMAGLSAAITVANAAVATYEAYEEWTDSGSGGDGSASADDDNVTPIGL